MATAPLLEIDDLHVAVDGAEILRGVSLAVGDGRGPRPHGPERLGQVDPRQDPARPTPPTRSPPAAIRSHGEDVTALPTDERAARGLFLGFQHPEEIPGVSVLNFLRQAMAARKGIADLSVLEVRMALMEWTKRLGMDDRFARALPQRGLLGWREEAQRDPPDGADRARRRGARRDRLRPRHRRAARRRRTASTRCASDRPELGILLITHYQRILDHLTPDRRARPARRPHRRDRRPRARRARRGTRASTRSAPNEAAWRHEHSTSRASRPTSRS